MGEYFAEVKWEKKTEEVFTDGKYSRGHTWTFDGGTVVPASSSPHIVKLPFSVEANVDPEEAFVASLSSCHMLFFLHFAGMKKFVVSSYVDNAVGVVGKNAAGKQAMTEVTLKPKVIFEGEKQPTPEELDKIHHQAHENCFIANSVTTEIKVEAQ